MIRCLSNTLEHKKCNRVYPPPKDIREVPKVLTKEKEIYGTWLAIHRNFPKVERFGIGQKIENSFLDVL